MSYKFTGKACPFVKDQKCGTWCPHCSFNEKILICDASDEYLEMHTFSCNSGYCCSTCDQRRIDHAYFILTCGCEKVRIDV